MAIWVCEQQEGPLLMWCGWCGARLSEGERHRKDCRARTIMVGVEVADEGQG